MNLFSTRNRAYLPVSAIVTFSGLYGAFNVEPVAAIATIVFYTVARARCPLIGCRVGGPSNRAGVKIDLCCPRDADVYAGQVFSRTGPTVTLLWVSDCDRAPSAVNSSLPRSFRGTAGSSDSKPDTSQDERLPLKYTATNAIAAKSAVQPIAYAQDCPIR